MGIELDDSARAERVMYRALELGLSFKVTSGRTVTLTPPLTISREEIGLAIQILDLAIAEIGRPEIGV
jgi:4-aminobutyrate aminotransferase